MKYHDKNGIVYNSLLELFSAYRKDKYKSTNEDDVIHYDESIIDENNIIPYEDESNIRFVKFESIMINFKDKLITVKYGNKIRSYNMPNNIRLNKIIVELLYYIDELI